MKLVKQMSHDENLNDSEAIRRDRRGSRAFCFTIVALIAGLFCIYPCIQPFQDISDFHSSTLGWSIAIAWPIAILILFVGVVWVFAEEKCGVLFLRRFRNKEVCRTIIEVIESGLGRKYRVITLDDSTFTPLETPRIVKSISRYGLLPIGCTVVTLALLIGTATYPYWKFLFGKPPPEMHPSIGDGVLAVLLFLVAAIAVAVLVIILAVSINLFFLLFAHRARIESQARVRIETLDDIKKCLKAYFSLSSRSKGFAWLAPQATVVKVTDELWQRSVQELLRFSEAVIIDVSDPSDNLLWEIDAVSQTILNRCVYIGDERRVEAWSRIADDATNHDCIERIAKKRLDGQPVLVYDPLCPSAISEFRNNLIRSLNRVAVDPRDKCDLIRSEGLEQSLFELVRSSCLSVLFYLAVFCLLPFLIYLVIKANK